MRRSNCVCVFFECYGDRRDLHVLTHSCPTRRSSDLEAVFSVPRPLIADAIDLIVFIAGRGLARRIETSARVVGLDPDGGYGLIDITPTADRKSTRLNSSH